jgi:homoprotocatechuate degradation regulator HpaR
MTILEQSRLLRDLTHSLPMALLRTREAVLVRFREVLSQHDLTEQQWRILRALDDQDNLEMSILAECCQILLPSITGILKRLEARKLIARQPSPTDGRITLIGLTKASRGLIEQIKPEIVEVYVQIEAILGKEKLEQLYGLLEELEEGLSV